MRNLILKGTLLAMAGVLGLVLADTARAQSLMYARIPFQFVAGDKALPAGEYLIKVDPQTRQIELRSREAQTSLLTMAAYAYRSEAEARTGRLVFDLYGDANVLRKVWGLGDARGQVLPVSRMHELARRSKEKPATTEVAAVPTSVR